MAVLNDIKSYLGIMAEDADLDSSINLKIIAVKNYLKTGGAVNETLESEIGVACIAIGVNDLLNQKAGESKFSPAFKMLANQICRGY